MAAPVLVLSGGNALGAYQAGVWSALEAAGVTPGWLVGTSIGAVNAAIIAGNLPDRRLPALQRFWNEVAAFDATASLPQTVRAPAQYAQALSSRLLGRPTLFTLRPPELGGPTPQSSVFSTSPMQRLLAELVDVGRLNSGMPRVSVLSVDLETGEAMVFDTARQSIGLHHIIASAVLIPDFPAVEIDGRLFVDGGFAANLPVHLALDEALQSDERMTCFAADVFPLSAAPPAGLLQLAQRQSDLIFASQTERTLQLMTRIWQGRQPGADVFLMRYSATEAETAIKGFDFSAGTLTRRQEAGARDMGRSLELWRERQWDLPGLTVHPLD